MNILEIKNLNLSFKQKNGVKNILRDVNLSIGENEILGLVGESGSGKTMTGFSIMKLLPPNAVIEAGSIIFNGIDISGLPDNKMRDIRGEKIGVVFQEPFTSLNPVLSVGYQISEALYAHEKISRNSARKAAIDLLDKVKVRDAERVFDNYPHQLSGGERQRVMIAIAISLNPKLLIADEPTTALDVTIQDGILKLLKRLKDEMGMSLLFITHDFAIINEMADRIAVLKDGCVVETGEKRDLLLNPRHPYTKELRDAVPRISVSPSPRAGGGIAAPGCWP